MNSIRLIILKYHFDNKKVKLDKLFNYFRFDYSKEQISNSWNYLISNNYLVKVGKLGLTYEVTDLGYETVISNQNQQKNENKKQVIKEQLEVENLRLQNESMSYQASLRNKQSEIYKLTIKNLNLQNKQLKRYILYAIIGFFLGILSGNFKDIWTVILEWIELLQ